MMLNNELVKISDLFNVEYGNSLELNKLTQDDEGINFVSRTSKNNGISAKVKCINGIEPFSSGIITVSLGGSVLEAFVQPIKFYTGYHIYCLKEKQPLTLQEKLYYCTCIRKNKYRYNYGRQANRTLKDLLIPAYEIIPQWVNKIDVNQFNNYKEKLTIKHIYLNIDKWKWFEYQDLFSIERGRGPRKKELNGNGEIPFVTSSDQNNGWTDFTNKKAKHPGNCLGVNRNGSVAEAFYQPKPFCSTEDVHVFIPKFDMNQYIGLFLATLIKKEKYRYNYGRKWGIARMKKSKIKLPVDKQGKPDWKLMEQYIKSLKFSVGI